MAVFETKYSVGDVVYFATTTPERKQHPCPDCLGEKTWKVTSPAGGEYNIACPRCSTRFMSDGGLSLDYTAHVPRIERRTIGSVQYNSAPSAWDSGARYMCIETGVGSGSVYDEARLFPTEEQAFQKATALAEEANRNQEWIVKLYDKALEISDYRLESAALKLAKDAKSRAGSLLYNLSELFSQIEEADDKDAILEAIDDYKTFSWERDKAAAVKGDE